MVVSSRNAGSALIVRLEGRLTLGPALHRIKLRVDELLAPKNGQGPSKGLVLDLSGVPDVDSAGLGELLAICTSATRRGLRVALANVNTRIKDVFSITRLDGVFVVCADEASALQHVA